MKKLIILLLLFAAVFAVFADDVAEFDSAKRDFDYIEHSDKVSRKSYILVADKFYRIYASGPRERIADESLHYSAQAYYRSYSRFGSRDDLIKALKYLKILAINYDSKLASMAFLQSSKIYEQQKDYPSAQYMLRKLIQKFPGTDDAAEAKDRLAAIDNRFTNLYADADKKPALAPKPIIKDPTPAPAAAVRPVKKDVKEDDDTADNTSKSKQVAYGDISTPASVPDGKSAVKRVRYFSTADYTRVVLDMSGKPEFDKHWLKADPSNGKPPRLFIDLNDVVVSPEIPQDIEIKDGLLKGLRWGYNRPGVARIVLDSDNVQDFTVFAMTDPERVVIDVSSSSAPSSPAPVKKGEDTAVAVADPQLPKANGGASTLASVFGLKIRSVVIDPGHGGKDPGASYYGIQEKDIVLDVGLEVARLLKESNPDLEVYMTRNKDVFIPLEERTAFANRKKADLFVSVHVNAAPNKNARGLETFVLNVTNDKKALAVAAFENQTTQKSMSDLQGILKDIMLNSKLEESVELASYVQKNTHSALYGNDSRYSLGVKQAPFYVLVGAKMPSILVETGFVSNREEADNLNSQQYRNDIAKGIYGGIMSYINIRNGK